jgi:hypothetical protein
MVDRDLIVDARNSILLDGLSGGQGLARSSASPHYPNEHDSGV